MSLEKQISFEMIKEMWKNLAVTEAARESISNAGAIYSESALKRQLKDTTDSRNMMEQLGTPPIPNVEAMKEALDAAKKGSCLLPEQLERVAVTLGAVRRLKDYLNRGKQQGNSLAYYEENLEAMEELREEISRQIRNGAVDDFATKELSQIRKQIERCRERMSQKAEQVMRSHGDCMADHYSTFRNGRLCVPVKRDCKSKIAGSVIDRSATGSTLFIEPSGVAKQYQELELLKVSEENEVYQILYTLTAMVAEGAQILEADISMIERLDFIFSKGKLSMDMGAVEPAINLDRRIVLKNARHPLMDRGVCVPLQFEIGEGSRGIVITGPNTGGKTVAIKTVMINCMMAQWGLHITCESGDICMNSSFLCDMGDGQNLSENLSTFSAHIKNVLKILGEVDGDSLVIMDELGSGTDPTEGMGIAIAILEELRKSGCLFLVTTHYPEVKEYARDTPGIVNARMTFDRETLRPTYQMIIGEAGESCAFHIADRLGMPGEMLETAIRFAYGEDGAERYQFQNKISRAGGKYARSNKIVKSKKRKESSRLENKFSRGDSVMVLPDKKIGIVCEPVNEKGILRVQLPGKKIWINHKRVKLQVAADALYPENYDFSIVFDTVENRKKRHDMERKYTGEIIEHRD